MNTQHHPVIHQTYATPKNAQYGADLATKETGFNHRVIELDGGAYAVVIDNVIQPQAESDNAPPRHDDEPPVDDVLTGELIPPEVKRKPRSKTATVVDFKAACAEANTPKSRTISSIIDSIGYVNIKEVCIELGWVGGDNEYPKQKHAISAASYAILDAAKTRHWNLTYKDACFFIYSGTHWQSIDDESIRHILKVLIVKFGYPEIESRSIEFINKLFSQFVHDASALQLDYEKQSLINLLNGTLKFSQHGVILYSFHSKDFATHQLDFDYNPHAQNPLFLSYLNDVLPDKDTQKTLQQIAGYLFVKDLKLELVFLLYGKGRNGKSVFQEVLTGVIGHNNVSSYSLEDLTKDTGYCRIKIANKIVNYGTDISMQSLKNDTFKVLASGEPIPAREIYRSNFEMRDYAKLIFNINKIDNANVEHTTGYFRRFLFVPFMVTIQDDKKDTDLHKKILSNKAGVLNWIIEGANEVVKNRAIFVSKECEDFRQQFIKECDNVSMFEEHYILNVVTEIKADFKNGKSLDDIISKPAPKNDDAKLLKKIAKLEREKKEMRDGFFKLLESDREDHDAEIESLNSIITLLRKALQATKDAYPTELNSSGLDEKLRKRLIQFCHPDPIQDPRKKAIAEDLTKELNGLAK